MTARIYRPCKNAMQSGRANARKWTLVYEPEEARRIDPLMGWTSSGDMKSQIKLTFPTKEDAIAYARTKGLAYRVDEPNERRLVKKAYADNFKSDRREPWTH